MMDADVEHRAAMDQGERTDRPAPQDRRPGQPDSGSGGGEAPREGGEENPGKRERSRPETLPSTTTSGGLPSEPGWMRP